MSLGLGMGLWLGHNPGAATGGGGGGGSFAWTANPASGEWLITGNTVEHIGLDGNAAVYGPLGHGTMIVQVVDIGPNQLYLGFTAAQSAGFTFGDGANALLLVQADGSSGINYGGPNPVFSPAVANGNYVKLTWLQTGHIQVSRSADNITYTTPVDVACAVAANMYFAVKSSTGSPHAKVTKIDDSGWVYA